MLQGWGRKRHWPKNALDLQHRTSVQPGSRSNSPTAQSIAGPGPSGPPLLGAFTRVYETGSGSDCCDAGATLFIASRAGITWARGKKHSKNGLATWFFRSDPASARAPDFNLQTPCGRAEQRRMGRIKILDVRRLRSRLVSKISAPAEQRKESRSDPDFGSPFFGSPYFGEAKKGKSPAAATERPRNAAIDPRLRYSARTDRSDHQSPTPC